jgi:proline iminopeptidase
VAPQDNRLAAADMGLAGSAVYEIDMLTRLHGRLLALPLIASAACLNPDTPGNIVPETVVEDSTLPSFQLHDGARVHLFTRGDPSNPALIMLHGGPGGDLREPLGLAALSDRYFVVFWDQRGAGLSERRPASDFTIDGYVADLDDVVTRFSPNAPVALFGHSWGAMYAALYIQRHPDRVAEAVLSEPGFLNASIAKRVQLFTFDLGSADLNAYGWTEGAMSADSYAREDFLLAVGQGWSQSGFYANPHDPENFKEYRLGATAMRASLHSAQPHGDWEFDFSTGLSTFCKPVTLIGTSLNTTIGYDFQKANHAPLFCQTQFGLIRVDGEDHGWVSKHPDHALAVVQAHLAAYGGQP